jgi:sulfide:quinone oxidoreductase
MRSPLSVLIAGGGVAALEATLALRHFAEDRVSIELVSPEPRFWYRPLSVVEPFDVGVLHGVDLIELAEPCDVLLTLDALASVDADAHVARTRDGQEIGYDVLLVAVGAQPVVAVEGAITFRGPADVSKIRSLIGDIAAGAVRSVVFAVPGGATWPLPQYELALQTARVLRANELAEPELSLVTPEEAPLEMFGAEASEAVAGLLADAGIAFRGDSYPVGFDGRALALRPEAIVAADQVVALPRVQGPALAGLPYDDHGFIPIDVNARVRGVDDVFAAGDVTDFPIKQGGLAAQQADAAAETIAASAGAPIDPRPLEPVLRGLLLTGDEPRFLRATPTGGRGDDSTVESEALWWPPAKIVGRFLTPFLAERAGIVLQPPPAGALAVDLRL